MGEPSGGHTRIAGLGACSLSLKGLGGGEEGMCLAAALHKRALHSTTLCTRYAL